MKRLLKFTRFWRGRSRAAAAHEELERSVARVLASAPSTGDRELLERAMSAPQLSEPLRAGANQAIAYLDLVAASSDPAVPRPAALVMADRVRAMPAPTPRPGGPVLFVSGTLARGGAERLVAHSVARLRDDLRPREVDLLLFDCSRDRGTDFYLPLTGLRRDEVRVQEPLDSIDPPFRWLSPANTYQWLYNTFRDRRPAAVHLSLEFPMMIGGLAAVMAGVPRIILATYNMRPTDFIADKTVCEDFRIASRLLLSRPEVRLTGLAPTCIDDYADWLGTDVTGRVTVVPNGFEMSLFKSARDPIARSLARRALGLGEDVLVVGAVMRLTAVKQPLLWVEVAAAVAGIRPAVRFVLMGDGDLLEATRLAVAENGLEDTFQFTGEVADVYSLLPALDLFLLTSESEGVPNAIVEAQASGVPAVARKVGAVADAMRPGKSGTLVESADPADIAEAVLAYIDDPQMRRSASAEAERFAREHFAMDIMVERLKEVIGD